MNNDGGDLWVAKTKHYFLWEFLQWDDKQKRMRIFLGKKKNQFEAHERKKRTHHTQHSKWSENEFD